MRKSGHHYKVYNGKAVRETLRKAKFYALSLPWMAGLLCGACAFSRFTAPQSGALAGVAAHVIAAHASGWLQIFKNALMMHGSALLMTVFLGFSLIGCPLLLLVPFFHGVGLGLVSGYFYAVYKLFYCLRLIACRLVVGN